VTDLGRWALRNLGTLGLALLLALVVWVVAVHEEDPIEEKPFPQPVPVEMVNLPAGVISVGAVTRQTEATVRAPRSIWDTLNLGELHARADLSGLGPGAYDVPLTGVIDDPVARIVHLEPAVLHVVLESQAIRELPVRAAPAGEPALGYEAGPARASLNTALIAGPASAVDSVSEIRAPVSLAGLRGDFDQDVTLVPVNAAGQPVPGVAVNPAAAHVSVPIAHKLGFRDVAVKVVVVGQVAAGYRITNITVAPPVMTVSSTDPDRVAQLPGYVETTPVNISGASDDLAVPVTLALPDGISPVGEQNVLVQVNIAAIESGVTVQRRPEIQGLGPGLAAVVAPETVDVILSGPLPVLDSLKQDDVRVILDLSQLGPGTYQITPQVSLLPEKLRSESVLPGQIEVTITLGVTPTKKP
jgi:YbbR domain-containing protein